MSPHEERLAEIGKAARKRINSPEARQMRKQVAGAFARNKPAEAEPDAKRLQRRVQAVADVDSAKAKQMIAGKPPAEVVEGDESFAAERLLGDTVDFLPVSFLSVGVSVAAAVARVVERNGRAVGSGFLVSGALFLTNNHVVASSDEAGELYLEFDYATDVRKKPLPTTRFKLDPARFFVTSPKNEYDFTVVAVGERVDGDRRLSDFGSCLLSDRDDKHALGEFVNLVQHPGGDYKQVVIRENQLVSRLETVLHYTADSLGGSSGSPVFNDEWQPVALHHWGGPHREQPRAGASKAVNEGIRISAIVKELKKAKAGMPPGWQALLAEALDPASRVDAAPATGVSESPRRPVEPQSRVTTSAASADGSVKIVLEIRVKGDGTAQVEHVAERDEAIAEGRGVVPDPDYSRRCGYDAGFLPGVRVPLPKVTSRAPGQKAKLLRPATGADPFELKYEHFSVVMNKTRKLPFVTAVNIDGGKSKKIDRKTGLVTSEGGDDDSESTETWYQDPRIAPGDQTAQPLYDRQRPRVFDRGHQVRREDPNWGDDEAAQRANADTFHFTNCCPQEFRFNERQRFWAGIEDYVLNNARAEGARVSVFTGPVFAATDPAYRGIRVPLHFYKVIARVEAGSLLATAFLADQSELISALPERLSGAESFSDLGRVREYLSTVAEIEELTGIDFGPLRSHDTNAAESTQARRPLRSEADLASALAIRGRPSTRRRAAPRDARNARDRDVALGGAAAESLFAFDAAALSADPFEWRTAGAAVLACQLAYGTKFEIEQQALNQWALNTCQCFTVGDDQCFVASNSDTALVAFRGSSNFGNWFANLKVATIGRPYGSVHRGFYHAMLDLREAVLAELADLGKNRVLLTGHSLGGAMALLFALDAPDDLPIRQILTFGQPAVGTDPTFVSAARDRFGDVLVRIVNDNDIVPTVPPRPYQHVGKMFQFDDAGGVASEAESLSVADGPPQLTEAEFRAVQEQVRVLGPSDPGSEDFVAENLFGDLIDHLLPRRITNHYIANYVAKVAGQVE
jgi:endonuclease G